MVNLQSCLLLICLDCHAFMCATLLYWWWRNTSVVTPKHNFTKDYGKKPGSPWQLQTPPKLLAVTLHCLASIHNGFSFWPVAISCIRATSWGVTSMALIKSSTQISLMCLCDSLSTGSLSTALAARSSMVKEDWKIPLQMAITRFQTLWCTENNHAIWKAAQYITMYKETWDCEEHKLEVHTTHT